MICYHDKTWCSHSPRAMGEKRCVNIDCPRNITPEHSARAAAAKLDFWMANKRTDACGYRTENDNG